MVRKAKASAVAVLPMTEYVYRPTRKKSGKRVRSAFWYGAYSLTKGGKVRRVSLQTTDKRIAEKRLRDAVVRAQMEAEGMVLPKEQREAARSPLSVLVAEYQADLKARTTARNAVESTARIRAAIAATGWRFLADVTPAAWVAYRATLKQAAKTRRDYQTSMMAFLNWLVRLDRLPRNPLERVDRISIKGKQVRPVRSFTDEEIKRLLAVATPARRLAYLFLLYTGLRVGTVRKLAVGDLRLSANPPYLLAPASIMKGAAKLAMPLRPELVAEIRRVVPADALPARPLFVRNFPKLQTLHRDFERAGIEAEDGQGRVVHFHAFRKTFQTLGVRSGVNQRAAQALLAHTDPRLTANVYTDVAALELHSEVAKLPWFGGAADASGISDDVATDAQTTHKNAQKRGFRDVLEELILLAKTVANEPFANLPDWCGRRESNPTNLDYQAFAVQCSAYLSGAGAVAWDAQVEAAQAAIGVLRVAEERAKSGGALTGAGRHPTPKGRGLRRSAKPDGMTRKDGNRGGRA